MELSPQNKRIVELFGMIRLLGAELVFSLYPLRLTEYEAEELLEGLSVMGAFVEANERHREDERMKELLKSRGK